MRNVSLAFVTIFSLLACSHQATTTLPVSQTGPDGSANGGSEPSLANNTDRTAVGSDGRVAVVPETPIYFAFDDATLSEDAKAELRAVADFMRQGGAPHLQISGNTDERGTEEYNIALGDRRAQAAREYLVRLGVDPARVDTISFGKLRPADDGHDESAWSKNRRDEFNLASSGSPNSR